MAGRHKRSVKQAKSPSRKQSHFENEFTTVDQKKNKKKERKTTFTSLCMNLKANLLVHFGLFRNNFQGLCLSVCFCRDDVHHLDVISSENLVFFLHSVVVFIPEEEEGAWASFK